MANAFSEKRREADQMKRITVVVPAFNAEKYLAETLYSIHRQTVKPYEVIVVNDCSTDRTGLIADSCGKLYFHDIKFSHYKHEENKGIGATRQDGIRFAQGNFIAFLSSDDVYHPDFIKASIQQLDQDPYAATFTDYYRCNAELKPFEVFRCPYYRTWEEFRILVLNWALQINMFVNFSSVVMPKNWFSTVGFSSSQRHGEDLLFLLDSLIVGCNWKHIRQPLLKYRIHGKSGSSSWVTAERDRLIHETFMRLVELGVPELVAHEATQLDKQQRAIYHTPLRRVLRKLKSLIP